MAINNLNPRRTVWFSPNEPSNKYDIWLSRNAHLDENGEPTTDSNNQRDCDYIFKIYDCGKWNPIVGFNSTARYKIDTVDGVEYSFEHDGTSHTKTGFNQFDLPLFRHPDNSPAELFSFGTLGESINEFVSAEEWGNIFNNPNFYGPFNNEVIGGDNYQWASLVLNLMNNGDIEIPLASLYNIGGIKVYTTKEFADAQTHLEQELQDVIDAIRQPKCMGAPVFIQEAPVNQIPHPWIHGFSNPETVVAKRNLYLIIPGPILRYVIGHGVDNQGEPIIESAGIYELGIGISVSQQNVISLSCTPEDDKNKYLKLNNDGTATEWVDININDIADVDILEPLTNLILLYNSSTGKWENGNIPSDISFSTINGSNVTVTGDLEEPGYSIHLLPKYKYICIDPLESLIFFNYLNPIFLLSYFEILTTDDALIKPVLKFDSSYDFIETYTVNSVTYITEFAYDSLNSLYKLVLKNNEKYLVTINGNKISIDEVSDKDSLFNV